MTYNDIDFQHALAGYRWYVSEHKMSYLDLEDEKTKPLFYDMPASKTIFRVMIKTNVTRRMLTHLVASIKSALAEMDSLP